MVSAGKGREKEADPRGVKRALCLNSLPTSSGRVLRASG